MLPTENTTNPLIRMRQDLIILRNEVTDNDKGSPNLAQALLSNKLFCCLFPILAYIAAVLLQTQLNDLVSIQYGSTILYLSFGVRLFVALIFGVTGLLWMVFGQVFIFTFHPTPYYIDHPVQSFVLTCTYSLIAFCSVALVRRIRNISNDFSDARIADVLWITLISSVTASIAHFAILGDSFTAPFYNVLTSFCAKFVGSMIGFYLLMLLFTLLNQIRISKDH